MPNRHILFLHRFRADDTENVVCDHREFQNQSVRFKFTAWQSFNSHIGFYFAVELLTNRMVMVKFDNPDKSIHLSRARARNPKKATFRLPI